MSLFGFLFQKEKQKVENVDFLVDAFKPIHKDAGDVKMFQFHIGSFLSKYSRRAGISKLR